MLLYSISVAVCDDERTQTEYLTALLRKWTEKAGILARVSVFDSAGSFLFRYEEDKAYDILLLDIQMGGMNGVDLARAIRACDSSMQIVFITGIPDLAAEGYEVSALHYLMKPVKNEKLFEVLDRARGNLNLAEKPLLLIIDGKMHRIPLAEIRYIEAQGHYITIKAVYREYRTKMYISEILDKLGNGFFRCQRSFIVNLRFVRRITRTAIVLDDMTEIPLSRDLYEAANRAVIEFFP